ncbi:helix-turn-helix transcriptional regulator [Formosa sediminum]|uniref:Helix-turn-helix transcriptional regulator n=1 Tax=Formosa sediminum TaxID=2594004 RepID=A0A516GS52_9FLAO|nr:helix-turn-helix transcriptional regulator [Formosa sediminum]QDO94200.1 helix-turn-helix transcriptional regulator [Formosa sediminum]
MMQQLYIKNMVCDRCKTSVKQVLEALHVPVHAVHLGQVYVEQINPNTYALLDERLNALGFELIADEDDVLIEQIKTLLIKNLEAKTPLHLKTSDMLTQSIPKTYSVLSKLFSKRMGITIEKYVIQLKIEKVKEYLQLGQLQFSEIADSLGYTSSSHLANQFKSVTGMSMSDYKALEDWDRKTIDKII